MSFVAIDSFSISPQARAWKDRASGVSNSFMRNLDMWLIKPLLSAGIWDELDYLALYATEQQSHALIPLKNTNTTTYNATAVNSPTFTPIRGFASNGSTSYVNTNWIPNTHGSKFTQNNASIGAYTLGTASAALKVMVGNNDGTRTNAVGRNATQTIMSINDNSNGQLTTTFIPGHYHAERTSSTARNMYLNGASLFSAAQASTTRPTIAMFTLAYNNIGTPTLFWDANVSIVYIGSNAVSASRMYSIIQNYGRVMGWAI